MKYDIWFVEGWDVFEGEHTGRAVKVEEAETLPGARALAGLLGPRALRRHGPGEIVIVDQFGSLVDRVDVTHLAAA
jgi:hypothetical protein